ncbi:MAG: succinate CoA transferase [Verrucomicrobiales bacterium]|jgi:acetyl-CoA hydrolase|nr:succinate CoA transferase [Verrucomicrobiales bacterium]
MTHAFNKLTAEEAAALINHNATVGFSAFTSTAAPKTISKAIAARASAEHAAGRPFQITVLTGASTGPSLDGALVAADAVRKRTPFQSDPVMRKGINDGKVQFVDMHLSRTAPAIRAGHFGKVNWAIVEACAIDPDGTIVLTTSAGITPTIVNQAERVLIELNTYHPAALRGCHDLFEPVYPPHRQPLLVNTPSDRIGSPVLRIPPAKIAGYVECSLPDEVGGFSEPDALTQRIGHNVAEFLVAEIHAGRIPREFLPIQSGVGDTANAVLGAMGQHPEIPVFDMYTEVVQDSAVQLMRAGKLRFASTVALTITPATAQEIYQNLDAYRDRFLIRPEEISNNPEIVRRLGVISMNTAIEADLFGNVNSTHFFGRTLMNGIGGSGDFTRSAWLSIFTCPSTQKGGKISTIVPAVSHVDHVEHDVQIIVTEQGVADLRGKSPSERAAEVIEKCAHPDYQELLRNYVTLGKGAHTPHTLDKIFAFHQAFQTEGDMRKARL